LLPEFFPANFWDTLLDAYAIALRVKIRANSGKLKNLQFLNPSF